MFCFFYSQIFDARTLIYLPFELPPPPSPLPLFRSSADVAGIAATLLTMDTSLTPSQVTAMILASATRVSGGIPLATIGIVGGECSVTTAPPGAPPRPTPPPTHTPTMAPVCLATTVSVGMDQCSCSGRPCKAPDLRCCSGLCYNNQYGVSRCTANSAAPTPKPTTSNPKMMGPTSSSSPPGTKPATMNCSRSG